MPSLTAADSTLTCGSSLAAACRRDLRRASSRSSAASSPLPLGAFLPLLLAAAGSPLPEVSALDDDDPKPFCCCWAAARAQRGRREGGTLLLVVLVEVVAIIGRARMGARAAAWAARRWPSANIGGERVARADRAGLVLGAV